MCSTFSAEPRGSQNLTGYRRAASASTRESALHLRLIRDIGKIKTDGSALMSAASRKRVIGTASGETDAAKRDPGTVALHTASILNGADVIRAHDVFSAVQSARVADALKKIYGEADGG